MKANGQCGTVRHSFLTGSAFASLASRRAGLRYPLQVFDSHNTSPQSGAQSQGAGAAGGASGTATGAAGGALSAWPCPQLLWKVFLVRREDRLEYIDIVVGVVLKVLWLCHCILVLSQPSPSFFPSSLAPALSLHRTPTGFAFTRSCPLFNWLGKFI